MNEDRAQLRRISPIRRQLNELDADRISQELDEYRKLQPDLFASALLRDLWKLVRWLTVLPLALCYSLYVGVISLGLPGFIKDIWLPVAIWFAFWGGVYLGGVFLDHYTNSSVAPTTPPAIEKSEPPPTRPPAIEKFEPRDRQWDFVG